MSKKILLLLLPAALLAGCTTTTTTETTPNTAEEYVVDQSDYLDGEEIIADIEESELSQAETDGLILMREEEKLARDVYTALYQKWGQNIFTNIADSEQTHTDAIKTLLNRYAIEDPVTDDTMGVFTNSTLQQLYSDLVDQGEESLLEALIVGATIEDLDIKDLNDLLEETDNEDITTTYQNLAKGSRNHMRAFVDQIERKGETYSAQYITEVEYQEIISSPSETGAI